MAASTSGPKSLKEYLKRYESNNEEDKKKKTKKTKKKTKPDTTGVLVVDEDPVWQKPVNLEEENGDDSADEEKPQVDEDIEVRRMKRLEQLRLRRPYNAIAEDGSGWVSLSQHTSSNYPDSDMSPSPRQRARNDTPSPEPESKPLGSGREDIDLSPPRQRQKRHYAQSPDPDTKPAHSTDLNSDLSPPRKRRAQNDTPSLKTDLSPPRRNEKYVERSVSADLSHQRTRRSATDNDTSLASLVSDLSPPRRNRKESSVRDSLKEQPKTGLITARDIQEEISQTKKDDWLRFKEMDPSVSGRGAEPVYRDKIKGNRISKDDYLKSKQKVEEKPKEKKLEWGKGLAQKREAEARLQELEVEKDKPFARTRDDPELDKMLKDRLRWGDPMAHLVKNKYSEPVLPDLGNGEKMKESGFVIPQDIPSHSWIKRGLDAAPNRYGIRPGRHWDGVDRSNGHEKQLFKRTNEKQATEREAYLWSVSDM